MQTPSAITARMLRALQVAEPSLDTSVGTPIRKIIDVVGEAIAEVYLDNYLLSYQYDIDARSGDDLDAFVSLFGFSRLPARRAAGTLILQRSTPAPQAISIPPGSQAATSDDTPTVVQTVGNSIIPRGATSVEVPVVAVLGGTMGNAPAGAIVRWIASIEGITSIINPQPLIGGTDRESDEQLRARFKRTLFRNIAGTEDAFLAVGLDDPDVIGAKVYGPLTRWTERIQIQGGAGLSSITPMHAPRGVRGATNANPVVITSNGPHRLVEGDVVYLSGVGGNVTANGLRRVLRVVSATEYALADLNGESLDGGGAYTSGGTMWRIARLGWSDPLSATFGTNIDLGSIAPPYTYTFTGGHLLPGIEVVDQESYPDGVYDLTYLYQSQATRNDFNVAVGAQNRVDLWVDGIRPATSTETAVVNGSRLFTAQDGSIYSRSRYLRSDGTPPAAGNLFVRLTFAPLIDVPDSIHVGNTELTLGTDFWVVRDQRTAHFGMADAAEGLEVSASSVQAGQVNITSSTNATPIVLTVGSHSFVAGQRVKVEGHLSNTNANGSWSISSVGGTTITLAGSTGNGAGGATGTVTLDHPVPIEYTTNDVVRSVQERVEDWRLVTTDVAVHQARAVPLRFYVAVILQPGFSEASISVPLRVAVSNLMDEVGIGGILQVSDLLRAMSNVVGVDAVRFLNSGDVPALTVTAATNASPIQISTSTPHGLSPGDAVQITGVGGNTAANGVWIVNTTPTGSTFTLRNSSGNGAFTSGGTAFHGRYGIHVMEADGTTIRDMRVSRDNDPYRALDVFANDGERFVLHSVEIDLRAQNLWGVG